MDALFSPLTLPNGNQLPNRLAKAAMEEHLAGPGQVPDERLLKLYRQWGTGGVGLIITGNVMVDARAVTGPAAVVLDHASPLQPFRQWAAAAKSGSKSDQRALFVDGRAGASTTTSTRTVQARWASAAAAPPEGAW